MKVLSIGNSFSQDAHRYIHDVAKADNYSMKTVDLYIGGCPLRKHYLNALEDTKAYSIEFNGVTTGFFSSIKEALMSDEWDIVTLQQVSHKSVDFTTYEPYLSFMKEYILKYCPKAKIYIHQTWAYEEGSKRLCEELNYAKAADMLADIKASYEKAADTIGAEGIIPCGEVMYEMLERGIPCVHRDTFHASRGLGRYAQALTWYAYLTGNDITDNTFAEFDEPVTLEEMKIAKESVKAVLARYGK